jgi:hypothetical protein
MRKLKVARPLTVGSFVEFEGEFWIVESCEEDEETPYRVIYEGSTPELIASAWVVTMSNQS